MKTQAPNATGAVSAFYGIPDKQDVVMIRGLSASMATPSVVISASITSPEDTGAKVTNVTSTDPGPFGGAAACADADMDGVPVGVCFWADYDTFGQVYMYYRSGVEAAAEPDIRARLRRPIDIRRGRRLTIPGGRNSCCEQPLLRQQPDAHASGAVPVLV